MPQAAVRVPASTANLGPGYDAFGLALALYDIFAADPAEEWLVEVGGEGAGELSTGADNQVARAMARLFAECGSGVKAAS
jgi:homoserine kinase